MPLVSLTGRRQSKGRCDKNRRAAGFAGRELAPHANNITHPSDASRTPTSPHRTTAERKKNLALPLRRNTTECKLVSRPAASLDDDACCLTPPPLPLPPPPGVTNGSKSTAALLTSLHISKRECGNMCTDRPDLATASFHGRHTRSNTALAQTRRPDKLHDGAC